jgi:prepilin-type N-terminal cleavage/methylation domain-containing protein
MHSKNMKNNRGFTLIEVLISVALTGMILVAGYSAFQSIVKIQAELTGTIDIQRNLFYLNEKITSLIRDWGTIDYEEYFNRNRLGYWRSMIDTDNNNTPDTETYTVLSEFGNAVSIFLCQVNSIADENACLGNNTVKNGNIPSTLSGQQKYWQYEALSLNHGSVATLGYATPNKLPPILVNPTPTELSELYLVKKLLNGMYERTFFRHIQVSYPGKTCDLITWKDCLGKLQMTRLISCADIDGNIEKWIPDTDFGTGDDCSVTTASIDDLTWVDVTSPDIDVESATFLPAPLKIPSLMSGSGEEAFAPSIQMRIVVGLSDLRQQKALSQGTDTRVIMTTIHLND